MKHDPDKPVILDSTPTEAEAAMIVAALRDAGIRCQTQGALTAGFRAEAPGDVGILVRMADLERARVLLKEFRALRAAQ